MSDPYIDTLIKPKAEPKTAKPKMWSLLFRNDDYTPMEFVVFILVEVLRLDMMDATEITLKVHNQGAAKVGRFTRDIAETKAVEIISVARKNEHPLTVEPVEAD